MLEMPPPVISEDVIAELELDTENEHLEPRQGESSFESEISSCSDIEEYNKKLFIKMHVRPSQVFYLNWTATRHCQKNNKIM